MSARTWSPLFFPYNCQLSELHDFKPMHYMTNIIAIQCKFKYSTCAMLNVNSTCVKLNKTDETECSAKLCLLLEPSSTSTWKKLFDNKFFFYNKYPYVHAQFFTYSWIPWNSPTYQKAILKENYLNLYVIPIYRWYITGLYQLTIML